MAGKAGALHRRPNSSIERDKIALTKIEQILDSATESKAKFDPTRLKALEMRYSRLRPLLSAVDQTTRVEERSEASIIADLQAKLTGNPGLIEALMPGYKLVRVLEDSAGTVSTVDSAQVNVSSVAPVPQIEVQSANQADDAHADHA